MAMEKLGTLLNRSVLTSSNGTTAIQLALQATLPRGSRVALPDFTFIATLNAIILAGMKPVLFPSMPSTWTIDDSMLWEHRGQFDAFIAVQPFGYRLEFDRYDEFSAEYEKPVIYDCAAGFDFKSHTTNVVCYSLHATKNLPVGEGGLISTDEETFEAAKRLSNFDFDDAREPMSLHGSNSKMDEIHSAILLSQLDRASEIKKRIERHKTLVDMYQHDLGLYVLPHGMHHGSAAPQICVLRMNMNKNIERLINDGPKMGVMFRRYYRPLLSQMILPSSVQVIAPSPTYFDNFIAMPSDLRHGEYDQVVDVIKTLCT